ncbi:M14 family zinc carboxypeptidase [Halobacillus karajensis]|uniref:Zinc carboxypeptidase n=1 Tax=Halobacillus karajensis TaxID=195088 RepID=A0A024P357_9BACI|nr:M14 family zinc carboxypeptidase [Halobacillus karajensis]CDQ19142.1 Zinc carboxypeptidase [Halobacillus karajensis]CDQ22784.1 Zinc carboxypeptidase [Halobacillus karajensis]
MKKQALAVASSLVLATSIAVPTYAAGNHPGTPEQQTYNSSGWTDHTQLTKKLKQLEESSQGVIEVDVVGQSNNGLDIYQARVGNGDKVILIESEIHGNEKTGTEAILNLLNYLGSSNSPHAKKLREEITLVALPKINPDASELDRRGNDMSWEEVVENFPQLASAEGPTWNHYFNRTLQGDDYTSKPGFDVNRDFNPDLNYVPQAEDVPGSSSEPGWYVTPEAQTVRDVYKNLQDEFGTVDVFVDLHHQGLYYVDGTSEPVTLSLSGQFVPHPETEEGSKYSQYVDNYDYDFSRQLNLAAYDALQEMGNSPFDNITLYSQGLDLPGTALGSFALNGSGTVLFEVTGQTQSMGQKKKGMLVKAVETGLRGIIDGVAEYTIEELNPEDYEDIPETSYRPSL